MHIPCPSCRPINSKQEALQAENERLRGEVQHLRELLAIARDGPEGPPTPQLADAGDAAGPSGRGNAATRPWQRLRAQTAQLQRQVNLLQVGHWGGGGAPLLWCVVCHVVCDIFRQPLAPARPQMAACLQQRTHLAHLQAELCSRNGIVQEADAMLSEAIGRLDALAGTSAAAASSSGSGAGGGSGAAEAASAAGDMAVWCKRMQHRLSRCAASWCM